MGGDFHPRHAAEVDTGIGKAFAGEVEEAGAAEFEALIELDLARIDPVQQIFGHALPLGIERVAGDDDAADRLGGALLFGGGVDFGGPDFLHGLAAFDVAHDEGVDVIDAQREAERAQFGGRRLFLGGGLFGEALGLGLRSLVAGFGFGGEAGFLGDLFRGFDLGHVCLLGLV